MNERWLWIFLCIWYENSWFKVYEIERLLCSVLNGLVYPLPSMATHLPCLPESSCNQSFQWTFPVTFCLLPVFCCSHLWSLNILQHFTSVISLVIILLKTYIIIFEKSCLQQLFHLNLNVWNLLHHGKTHPHECFIFFAWNMFI